MSNNSIPESPPSMAQGNRPANGRRAPRWLLPLVLILVVVVGGPFGYRWWLEYTSSEYTDNATMQGSVVSISSKITGTIAGVDVVDYQRVQAGDVLVRLDQSDLEVSLRQAQASLDLAIRQADAAFAGISQSATQAGAQTTQAHGGLSLASTSIQVAQAAVDAARLGVATAEARLAQAQAQFEQASGDYQRYQVLNEEGVIPAQQLDHAKAAYEVAQAGVDSAQNDIAVAQSKLDQAELNVQIAQAQQTQSEGAVQGAQASVEQTDVKRKQYDAALAQVDLARVALDAATLQLSYTTITAPADGRLGRVSAQVGQRISAGQPLMPLVLSEKWVIANFKETQVDRMRSGQPVTVNVDAYPERVFQAHVDSISPASGATFALLPPENATGNFTKVIQLFRGMRICWLRVCRWRSG
jgi:membrane fusion protein (multidrug efflux system)